MISIFSDILTLFVLSQSEQRLPQKSPFDKLRA